VFVTTDWAMIPLAETERRDFLGDLRGSLSDALDDPHFQTAGKHGGTNRWRSHRCRRYPRPVHNAHRIEKRGFQARNVVPAIELTPAGVSVR
jgi:hypothetical protein